MKADTFMNAVGMTDERYLDIEIPKKSIEIFKWKKALISCAAAAALIACPLPTMTAFGVGPAYDILYNIAPSVAQTFKPVQKSCEDNGIEMNVISAKREGSEASVYLAMHDAAGVYPEGEWDLFDSYRINVPKDMTGTCSFSEYDADTHTAYFVVHIETMDGSKMPKGKVTFSVREMLLGKTHTTGTLKEIDMSNIPYEPQTQALTETRGNDNDVGSCRFLLPSERPLCTPAEGVSVMNIGYIDGALHILTKYDDIKHTDDHGWVSLRDKDGNDISDISSLKVYDYWDTTHTDSYTEQIFPVSYDELGECSLYGEFTTAQGYVSGNWQITFPLE